MKNKILTIIILVTACLSNSSCDDWLDVTPQAQVNADKLFTTPDGFENALFGIYTSLTSSSLYGMDMTWGMMDVLAQYYDVYTNKYHDMYEGARYNYNAPAVKDCISGMWLTAYNSIANCNVLLEYLQQKEPTFFQDNKYELILSETLALRAMLHFDLLRAFAPSWQQDKDALCLPYADNFKDRIHRQRKTSEIVPLIIRDLEKAREILRKIDRALKDDFKDMYNHYVSDMDDVFGTARAYRMNYWAVTGLLARVHHYMGDPKAYTYAKEVIEAAEKGFFRFTTESEVSAPIKSRDVTLQNESLFALSFAGVHDLWYSHDADSYGGFFLENVKDIYPSSDDFRSLYMIIENSNNKKISIKYADVESEYGGKVPMIRLSEMYLIAAESGFETDKAEAVSLLETLKANRGTAAEMASSLTFEEFRQELTKEARREFLGEGQLFYWYKRLGLPVMQGNTAIALEPAQYCLPLPAAEVEFGGRKEDYIKNLMK